MLVDTASQPETQALFGSALLGQNFFLQRKLVTIASYYSWRTSVYFVRSTHKIKSNLFTYLYM
jgi:hypothetical protein